MNKAELIAAVAEKAGTSIAETKSAVDATLEVITEELRSGGDVTLIGFGAFRVKDRPERQGRNPQTGEPMTISAAKIVSFKVGSSLKDAVNS